MSAPETLLLSVWNSWCLMCYCKFHHICVWSRCFWSSAWLRFNLVAARLFYFWQVWRWWREGTARGEELHPSLCGGSHFIRGVNWILVDSCLLGISAVDLCCNVPFTLMKISRNQCFFIFVGFRFVCKDAPVANGSLQTTLDAVAVVGRGMLATGSATWFATWFGVMVLKLLGHLLKFCWCLMYII